MMRFFVTVIYSVLIQVPTRWISNKNNKSALTMLIQVNLGATADRNKLSNLTHVKIANTLRVNWKW